MTDERALSTLFHDTLDAEDPTGPFQRLQLELEKSSGAAYRRRARRIVMTRNRLVLLAAALVALLLAGVLVGTRLYNNVNQPVPGGHAGIDQAQVARLLARPLLLPLISAKNTCSDGPRTVNQTNGDRLYGNGPAYEMPGPPSSSAWGDYGYVGLITPPGLVGPIVLRGRDVRLGLPMVFVSSYGVGSVYGTDHVDAKTQNQYTALALDTDHPPAMRYAFGSPYVLWNWEQGIAKGSSMCLGYQIDGPSFTEVFYSSPGNQ